MGRLRPQAAALYYSVPCYAMPCCAMIYHAMLFRAMLYRAMLRCAIYSTRLHDVSQRLKAHIEGILDLAILNYTTLYCGGKGYTDDRRLCLHAGDCVGSFAVVRGRAAAWAILYCTTLYYTALYCTILHCTVQVRGRAQ